MQNHFDEEEKVNNQESEDDSDYAYKNVIKEAKVKTNRRTLSVIALLLAILSVAFFWAPWWISLTLSFASVILAIVSRKILSYFDTIALTAIFIAIFGVVFAFGSVLFNKILENMRLK